MSHFKGNEMKKQFKKILVTALVIGCATITPAFAENSISSYGSSASYSSRTVRIQDTKDDGHGVYALYRTAGRSDEKKLENYSGPGTTTSKAEATSITKVKACVDDWFTNTCSRWTR